MVEKMTQTFTVEATHTQTGWWVLEAMPPGCIGQVRTLDKVDEEMREAIAYLAKIPEEDVRIEVKTVLDSKIEEQLAKTLASIEAKEEANRVARENTLETIRTLIGAGFTHRDIGKLLGITHQRVSQLVHA